MEGEEDASKGCRSWEEDIYWTHFRSVSFFRILVGDFEKQLAVPKKFAENMKKKIAGSVFLKGPSGSLWTVGLAAEEGNLFLKKGWEAFVKDHLLSENDVLFFKYDGDSGFEVLMFDHRSFCEKEASYFCKRVENNKSESEGGTKRKVGEAPEVVIKSPLPQEAGHLPAEEPRKEESVPATIKDHSTVSRERASDGSIPVVIDQGAKKHRRVIKGPSASLTLLKEDRGQHNQLEAAGCTSAQNQQFSTKITATHRRLEYLNIPLCFARSNRLFGKRSATLKDPSGRLWCAKIRSTGHHRQLSISHGWRNFSDGNKLKIGDVCVFKLLPGEEESDSFFMAVHISKC